MRAVHPAKSKLAELKRRLLVALLTVTFYYYPSYLTTALSLFECYHIDPTSQQLEQYYPENAQVLIPFLKCITMLMVLHSIKGSGTILPCLGWNTCMARQLNTTASTCPIANSIIETGHLAYTCTYFAHMYMHHFTEGLNA